MDFGVVGGLIAARIDVFIQPLCAMFRTIFSDNTYIIIFLATGD
jgi:hypothetical protein